MAEKIDGSSIKMIEKNSDYTRWEHECSGKGVVISYDVFEGIAIVFMEFDSEDVFMIEHPKSEILEIAWCQKGRVECEFSNHTYSHLSEGDFWIGGTKYVPISYSFSYRYFQAISLVIDKGKLTDKTKAIMASFSIDIDKMCDKLFLEESWYICRSNEELKYLFEEISKAKYHENVGYFAIKVLELLHYVNKLNAHREYKIKYYSKVQIEAVKNVQRYLITHLDEKCVLGELVDKENISKTMFQTIFAQIYGDSPYAYLKRYKMGIAAQRLIESNEKISDIAACLGYNNYSKFSAAFRDIYHMLPKDYRKTK